MSSPPVTSASRVGPAQSGAIICSGRYSGRYSGWHSGLFWTGLLALVALVFALPVFPSGDGPVHIYFSRILFLLASHQAGVYGSVYSIRHLVQPYCLHYFWLIGCEQFTSPPIAEKSFVAVILLVNALGFRFLARQLGTSAPVVSLWILPLLLSWALGSGFLNFCFAAGVLFIAYGLYLRLAGRLTRSAITGYSAALFVLVLSHPVPLLMLLLLLAGDTTLLLWNVRRTGEGLRWRAFRPQALCLSLACIAFVFPMLIADKASVAGSLLRGLRPHAAQAKAIVSGDRLSLFFGTSVPLVLFTVLLVALLPAAVTLVASNGGGQRLLRGTARPADRLCLIALLLLAATIVFPQSMNGSALFADRMVPLLWPFVLVCAAGVPFSPSISRGSTLLAMLATAASLLFALLYLLPAARQQQALTDAPLPSNAKGLFIAAPLIRRPFGPHLKSELLAWGGARAFAAHNDVLLNSPWMQLTIVPIRENGAAGLLRDHLPGSVSESPVVLDQLLETQNAKASQALAGADFLLYSAPGSTASAVSKALPSHLPAQDWQCTVHDFYAVCRRKGNVH
jgi:hypothetical protein